METQGRGWRTLDEVAAELQVSRRIATLGRWGARALAAVAVAAALLASAVTLAASSPPNAGEKVPRQIPYRGYLDQNGAPVTDPAVTMRFELYTQEAGGTWVWAEEQSPVSVLDGNFSVALGDVTPINPALFAQPSLYLAITVNGQQLQGRQRLLSVPYAHHAAASSAVPPGTVVAFMGQTAPAGWLLCDGTAFDAATYPALAAVLQTTTLPDLRSRFLLGVGQGNGLANRTLGEAGGAERHALSEAELPAHAHAVNDPGHTHPHQYGYRPGNAGMWHQDTADIVASGWDNTRVATGAVRASQTGVSIQNTGGGAAHPNIPPFFAVNWIIKAVH